MNSMNVSNAAGNNSDLVDVYVDDTLRCVATQEIANKFHDQLLDCDKNELIEQIKSLDVSRGAWDSFWGSVRFCAEFETEGIIPNSEDQVPFRNVYARITRLEVH